MKKLFLLVFFIGTIVQFTFCDTYQGNIAVERVYCSRILSFNHVYDIYFTEQPCGYYRFEDTIGDKICYLTYEGREFYRQCLFDENVTIVQNRLALNLYTNSRGEMMRFHKKFGPVIEKNRQRKNYPYGYGRNYGGYIVN